MSVPAQSVVVDLGAVGRASVALARWYAGLVANGEADVAELARARAELGTLAPQPGPLGRAVALVVSGGDDATDAQVMAAVALLCDAAGRAGSDIAAAPGPRPKRRPQTTTASTAVVAQPTLPGLDAPDARG